MRNEALKKLYDERLEVWTRMQGILDTADKRGGQAVLTAEEEEPYDKAEARLQELNKAITRLEQHSALEKLFDEPRTPRIDLGDGDPRAQADSAENRAIAAFDDWVRHGTNDMQRMMGFGAMKPEHRAIMGGFVAQLDDKEARDIGVATGSAGGFMVPQGFLQKLTEVMKYFGPMRQLANIIQTTSGNDMPWPNNDDTANVGAILGENVAITPLDVAFTSKTLKAFMYTSLLVKASWQLLNDSAFDVEGFLTRKLGQRIGRIQNTHFSTGTGTGQPEGFTTNALANSPKVTMATGNSTGFSTGAIGLSALIDTLHAVNYAYRIGGNLKWQMADSTLAATRKLQDSQGRPLWIPAGSFTGVAGVDPDTLLGYPVLINSDMAAFAANAVVAAVGDWREYYIIRDVLGIQMVRLDERYADQLQAGFFAFARTDGRVDDVKAAAFLQASAT